MAPTIWPTQYVASCCAPNPLARRPLDAVDGADGEHPLPWHRAAVKCHLQMRDVGSVQDDVDRSMADDRVRDVEPVRSRVLDLKCGVSAQATPRLTTVPRLGERRYATKTAAELVASSLHRVAA